jgi:hypothetical protein
MHIESGKLFYPPGFGFIITSWNMALPLSGADAGAVGK